MGILYIVATPIGNLEDITLRALRILKKVDLIACEDTRRTRVLLGHFKISKPLVSFHQHSRLKKIDYLMSELKQGKNIALTSDAGTPGVADPAGVLIGEALANKIELEPIPGPSALTTILSVAPFETKHFIFLGFLPKKKGRSKLLKLIAQADYPLVLFESPHRIIKTLKEIQQVGGDKYVVIGREMTKKFQEIQTGFISEVLLCLTIKGEFTLIIKP